jgi:hypothetical protein
MKIVSRIITTVTLITLAFLLQTSRGGEKADKLKEAVAKTVVTQEMLRTLTYDQVPEEWRTRAEDKVRSNITMKVFWRGKDKVLEVFWRKDWTGARSNMFCATVYDGQQRIGKVVGLPEETCFTQPEAARLPYSMLPIIKHEGRVSLMFRNDRGYLQVIEVKGRGTSLMDDIEYTRMAVGTAQLLPPLWEAINELRTQPTEEPHAKQSAPDELATELERNRVARKARLDAGRIVCIDNLRQLDAAKYQWALERHKTRSDTPSPTELQEYLPGKTMVVCPDGGTYSLGQGEAIPTCTIDGHKLE